jgi:hypothetical protein
MASIHKKLIDFIAHQKEEEIKDLLSYSKPLYFGDDKRNPLHTAVFISIFCEENKEKSIRIIKILLDTGYIDITICPDIIKNKLYDVLKLFLSYIDNNDNKDEICKIFFYSILYGESTEMIETVLSFMTEEEKSSVENILENGRNILTYCACYSNYEKLKYLLTIFPKMINKKDSYGITTLYTACIRNKKDMCKLLLENQADINVKNKNGETCLHCLCRKGNLDLLLMFKIENSHIMGRDMKSLLYIASENNRSNIVEYLLSLGIDF